MLQLGVEDGIEFEYFAEGAANVVYKIHEPISSPASTQGSDSDDDEEYPPTEISPPTLHPALARKMLRLRKNVPSAATVLATYSQFSNAIATLFPAENLVQQTLVKVAPELIRHCNKDLVARESRGERSQKRRGTYLLEGENLGTLVTDMSCSSIEDDSFSCVEFKPKWLAQSPSAPKKAKRCRTCALRAMHDSENAHKSERPPPGGARFCPLALVSDDQQAICDAVNDVLGQIDIELREYSQLLVRITEFLLTNPLLHHLKKLQTDLDPTGTLKADVTSSDFGKAMTLRDCTLFLKVWHLSSG